jgi:hypothetical protein
MSSVDEVDDLTPMAGDLLGDGEGAVVTVRGGLAAMLPTRADRLTEDQHEVLADLERHALEVAKIQGHLRTLVGQARGSGVSWSLIGWATGLTGEGARVRYADADPSAMPRRRSSAAGGRRKR